MGMTMTQKILAKHAGLASVEAGQLIEAKLDLVLGNDITTPVAITEFDKAGLTQVFDKDKIAIVLDHSVPCKDIKSAQLGAQARAFAQRFDITHFYDVGQMGVEHALIPEKGLAAPGEAIIGADGVHGYKETPQVSYIEGAVTDREDLDLEALVGADECTVTLELNNGKIITLSRAWFAGDGTASTEEAEIPIRFESKSRAQEVK